MPPLKADPPPADWALLRRRYEEERVSLRQLARDHKLSRTRLGDTARAEGWCRPVLAAGTGEPRRRHPRPEDEFLLRVEALVDGYLGRIEQRFSKGADQPDADTRDLATLARIVDKLSDLSARRRQKPEPGHSAGALPHAQNAETGGSGGDEAGNRAGDDWADWDSPAFFDRFARHVEEAVRHAGLEEPSGEPAAEGPPALDA